MRYWWNNCLHFYLRPAFFELGIAYPVEILSYSSEEPRNYLKASAIMVVRNNKLVPVSELSRTRLVLLFKHVLHVLLRTCTFMYWVDGLTVWSSCVLDDNKRLGRVHHCTFDQATCLSIFSWPITLSWLVRRCLLIRDNFLDFRPKIVYPMNYMLETLCITYGYVTMTQCHLFNRNDYIVYLSVLFELRSKQRNNEFMFIRYTNDIASM